MLTTTGDPAYRDVETLAHLAGPEMVQMLRAVKAGRPGVAPAEVRRRFGALCADAMLTPKGTRSARTRGRSRKTRRTRRAASGSVLAREIERVDELGVRVALAGMDEAIAATDRVLSRR